MGKLLGSIIWVTTLIIGVAICSANAAELSFFDYDRTIFEPKKTNKTAPGIYDSKVILYLIENRPNLLVQIPPDAPREIEVSSLDLKHKMTRINEITEAEESLLAPKDGRIGSLEPVKLSDGTVIIPGLYRVEVPASFKYFRESPAGRNYLLEEFKRAEMLEVEGIGTFRGPHWNHMVQMLSDRESAKQFGIITARGHSTREWQEFFNYLLEKGYIKNLPNMRNIHNINRPEYEKYGMGDGDSVRKIGLLKKIAQELTQIKTSDTDNRLHPNGQEAGKFHSLFFVDDNQRTLDLAYEELRDYAMRRWNVKFIIGNSGPDHEVKRSKRPKTYVISDSGTVRPATDFEAYGEPFHLNDKKFVGAKVFIQPAGVGRANNCSAIFN